jgi:excisionase family DNA binding protein
MANEARMKGKQLLQQMSRTPGCDFYMLHLTSWFDPTDPAALTIDAITERSKAVKQAAKYVWSRVLKHPGAGFITALEVAPGGMVHIHAIYYGRYQDVRVIRTAWLEKMPDSPQLLITALSNPEDAVPEVFKYMMKLASPRDDEHVGYWMDPILAARVEVALSGKRRSESYGAFRGVKLEAEPAEEEAAEVRCIGCGNTERFNRSIVPRGIWQREHPHAPIRLSRTGLILRIEETRRRRKHATETKTVPPIHPGPALPMKHTFSVTEVAEFLGVNHKTIREQITAGRIGSIRLGRVIRIPRSEVLKLLGE